MDVLHHQFMDALLAAAIVNVTKSVAHPARAVQDVQRQGLVVLGWLATAAALPELARKEIMGSVGQLRPTLSTVTGVSDERGY